VTQLDTFDLDREDDPDAPEVLVVGALGAGVDTGPQLGVGAERVGAPGPGLDSRSYAASMACWAQHPTHVESDQ
jgi:hypothetical protein